MAKEAKPRLREFSESSVLRLPEGYHRDPGESFLYVRVYATGTRSYVTRVNDYSSGKRRQLEKGLGLVGDIPLQEARLKAREAHQNLLVSDETKARTAEAALRAKYRASACWDEYLHERRRDYGVPDDVSVTNQLPKTLQELTYCGRHFSEYFKDRPLIDITESDIEAFLAPLRREHVTAAKNRLNYLSGFFNFWKRRVPKLVPQNPCSLVEIKLPARTAVYALDETDVAAFIETVNTEIKPEDPVAAAALLFLLTSGQRPDETLSMVWHPSKTADNYPDFSNDTLVFGTHKTDRFYTDPLVVSMPPGARSVLETLAEVEGNRFVFPSTRRRFGQPQHISLPTVRDRFTTAIDAVAEELRWTHVKRQKITLYSLRHTYASHASKSMTLQELMTQLKHSNPSTAARYYLSRDELRRGIAAKSPDFLKTKRDQDDGSNEDA